MNDPFENLREAIEDLKQSMKEATIELAPVYVTTWILVTSFILASGLLT